jgi:hypothetical protein
MRKPEKNPAKKQGRNSSSTRHSDSCCHPGCHEKAEYTVEVFSMAMDEMITVRACLEHRSRYEQ